MNRPAETPYQRLQRIIAEKDIRPTIINPDSKFVVVTYWWGRGVPNRNTARPCLEFYERILTEPFEYLKKINDSAFLDTIKSVDDVKDWIESTPHLLKFYIKKTTAYASEYFMTRKGEKFNKSNYDHNQFYTKFYEKIISVASQLFFTNVVIAQQMLDVSLKLRLLRLQRQSMESNENKKRFNSSKLELITELSKQYSQLKAQLKQLIRPTVLQMEPEFRFKQPIVFNKMIYNWEQKCIAAGCNYMAVEYPEFARPGGYQMAINAKPLFIQKALHACDGRAVVYIDGDMTINKYPHLFDLDDVDFMARGWHIDPRASSEYQSSIMVDPYVFETSGGIMYFSNSLESNNLLQGWINESAKPHQQGKADDRIISLIFNIKRLLAPMKIIQLPIEYLWLTMSYDDYVEHMKRDEIFVEHPECLTSEDTATSSGASSDRSAKFSAAINSPYPRSEMLYECAMFPTKAIADQFRPWFNYLGEAVYQDDVADYDEGLIGEQAFYVIPFDKGFGKYQSIFENNMKRAKEVVVEPTDTDTIQMNTIDIPKILHCLLNGKNVLYVPTPNKDDIENIKSVIDSEAGRRLEFIFSDANIDLSDHMTFNYIINTSKPIFMRAGNPILAMMIALSKSVLEKSNENIAYERMQELFNTSKPIPFELMLSNNYQFISRIRIHIMKARRARMVGGSLEDRNTDMALEFLYPTSSSAKHGGGKRKRSTIKRRKLVGRTRRRSSYSRKN